MTPAAWWQRGVIYQIYPRSFQDSNDDGIGDLRGAAARIAHLRDLGVDVVWLSPIFRSPMADLGYDISDYTDIDPVFGTLHDFDQLLNLLHDSGIKVLLDLVPNHTSDQHPWFRESRGSRNNAKRDWYLWHDAGRDGGPPNNWLSDFGGSAWQFDETTGQYYYHAFLAAQPDLNWRNPEVRRAMYDVMRFWLRRGVDGFRVDVIWHLVKDAYLRDNPPNPEWREGRPPHERVIPLYTTDLPETHDVIAEMRRVVDEFPERLLIGEIYLPIERLVAYYGRDLSGVHLPFNFTLLRTAWTARNIARLIDQYEGALPAGGWPNWVLGNHDNPRVATRVGPAQAGVAAMLLLTLRGTPTIYNGDEIGMRQVPIAPPRIRDPLERNVPGLGRDGARTPVQWDSSVYAGFSRVEPWLPVADDHRHENVDNQRRDPTSLLNLHRRLIHLRRQRNALTIGTYRPIVAGGELLLFVRESGGERLLVALNFGHEPLAVAFAANGLRGTVLESTFNDRQHEALNGSVDLRPDEGIVIDLAGDVAIPATVV
jgi:alpha-glucosidase